MKDDFRSRSTKTHRTGIRFKLSLVTFLLIGLITTGTSLVVIQVLDNHLLQSLIKRGDSIALSTATPAGYSILANDYLALDNLAAKIEASQNDVVYLAILDVQGKVLAHSSLEVAKESFQPLPGRTVASEEGRKTLLVNRNGHPAYEFSTPIRFADSLIGQVIVGIDAGVLEAARASARDQIILVSLVVLIFGMLGTFFLSNLITTPIERLAAGVSRITAGDYRVNLPARTHDELGELTRSFNEMSRVIMNQKNSLEANARNLEEAYVSTVRVLAAALDARDNYTYGHSARVSRLALLVGGEMGLSDEELKELEMACFLHDIGKIYVPDSILNKERPLTADEFEIIKLHPLQGAKILHLADSLHKYIPVVLQHHEWYNGAGYPDGLKEGEIHPHAQIVAIADSFDAMRSSRPYRKGCTREEAAAEILKFRGTQFNPQLSDTFLDILKNYEDDPLPENQSLADETKIYSWPSSSSRPDHSDVMRAASPGRRQGERS